VSTPITIDSAGRVLLPSAVRRRLNLRPGSQLIVDIVAERIELTPASSPEPELISAASGRKVLKPTGEAFDAAGATRAERQAMARRGKRR